MVSDILDHPVLTQLFFPKPPSSHASAQVIGENRQER